MRSEFKCARSKRMLLHSLVVDLIFLVVSCKSLPYIAYRWEPMSNNSFIEYNVIDEEGSLKCVTNTSIDCCNDASVGNWSDVRGSPVQEGRDGTSCLYVTRGDGEITLNRKSGCFDYTSGLWRCDIPDSSGDMQILYIYIGNYTSDGIGSMSIYTA